MKLFRFMSNEEFSKYKCNNILRNDKIHIGKTNSVGFCFLSLDDYSPEEAVHFLSGVASFDVCAVFETEKILAKSKGTYGNLPPSTGNVFQDYINILRGAYMIEIQEYCTNEYSKKDFKLLKYSKNIWEQWQPREIQSELKWEVCDELQTTKRYKKKNGKRNTSV